MKIYYRYIAISIVLMIAAVASLLPVAMLPMMFDAPGSDSNGLVFVLAATIALFPLSCLSGAVLPWLFRRRPHARWLFLLPVVNVALILAAMAALDMFCDGGFVCR